MALRSRVVYLTTILLTIALSDVVLAFNITKILSTHPELSVFNELLSRTKVADVINSRHDTMTVLAADNRSMEALTRLPLPYVAGVLMGNVLLDYFDVPNKLDRPLNETKATNLFQTTSVAGPGQGFVVLNRSSSGVVMFRADGQTLNASRLVGQVFANPYNISVLQVSDLVVAPGMLTRLLPPPPPVIPPAVAPSHAPSPGGVHHAPPAPLPAGDDSPPPGDDEGGSDDDSDAEAPAASGAWAGNVGVAAVATVGCLMSCWLM